MTHSDVCDLLPDADDFKKTKYYVFSERETKSYNTNLNNPNDFYDREKARMKADKNYYDYMKNKYKQFSHKGNRIYNKIYNKIFMSNDICAYCNLRNRGVEELDHFFPKDDYPSLSITVENLVPSCSYCNHPKNSIFPRDYVLLHPYYDNCLLDVYDYLKYTIKEFNGYKITGEFTICKTENMSDEIHTRIKKHFEFFKLDKYYGKDFISDYDEFIESIDSINDLKKKLEIKRDYNKNKRAAPWLYAGFDALIKSEEFYSVVEKKIGSNGLIEDQTEK